MLTAWGHFHLWGNRTTLMRFQRASASGRPIRDGDRLELAACCRMPFPKPASRRFRRERHAGLPGLDCRFNWSTQHKLEIVLPVGSVHCVVSADGKTLTVNYKGTHPDGKTYDDTLVFDKQ